MHYNNSSIFALYHALVLRYQSILQINNSKQFGIEAPHRWGAGRREEVICPRSWVNQRPSWKQYSWMLAPGVRPHHHQPTPAHRHRKKNQVGTQHQGRAIHATQGPGCPRWQVAVQIGNWVCRLAFSTDGCAETGRICCWWNYRICAHLGNTAFHPQPSLGVCARFLPRAAFQEGWVTDATVVFGPPGPFLDWLPPEPGLCAQSGGVRSRGDRREG